MKINYLEFRKKGNEVKGFLGGAITGMVIGGLIGIISGDDEDEFINFTAVEKAVILGVLFSVPGSVVGVIKGGAKFRIPITGNQKNYNSQRANLEKYMYKYWPYYNCLITNNVCTDKIIYDEENNYYNNDPYSGKHIFHWMFSN